MKGNGSTGRINMKIAAWGGIAVTLLFLSNPDFGIFDIFPDFIGYILLCAAISKLADIDEHINEAHTLFVRMIYVSIAKFVALFILFGVMPTTDQTVGMLLFSFTFSVFELLYVIPAIFKLTEGILYLSARHGGEVAYTPVRERQKKFHIKRRKKDKYQKSITEKARNTTIAFIIIKALCRTLPEFASLAEQTYDSSITGFLYQYIGLFRVFGGTVALIVAIIFSVSMVRYVLKIKNDNIFIGNLKQKYQDEILSQSDRPARRAVKAAFSCIAVASVLKIDFNIDNYNILPDVLLALCIIAGLLLIKKYIEGWKITATVACVLVVVSAVATFFEFRFNARFYPEAILRDAGAYDAYTAIVVSTIVAELLFILLVFILLFVVVRNIIEKHTGFSMTVNDSYDPTEKIKQLHRALTQRLIIPMIFAIIVSAAKITALLLINTVDFMWMIKLLLAVIYAYFTIKVLSEVNEQIDYKYMLS